MARKEYPLDYFFSIENEPDFIGRIVLSRTTNGFFQSEIAIVYKEGHRIYQHIQSLFNQENEEDTLSLSTQILANYLRGQR